MKDVLAVQESDSRGHLAQCAELNSQGRLLRLPQVGLEIASLGQLQD